MLLKMNMKNGLNNPKYPAHLTNHPPEIILERSRFNFLLAGLDLLGCENCYFLPDHFRRNLNQKAKEEYYYSKAYNYIKALEEINAEMLNALKYSYKTACTSGCDEWSVECEEKECEYKSDMRKIIEKHNEKPIKESLEDTECQTKK